MLEALQGSSKLGAMWATMVTADQDCCALRPSRTKRYCPQTSARKSAKGDFMPAKKLTDAEIQQRLQQVKTWSLENGKLHRAFECKDFVAAFGNMTRVALVAESMNHHPEWFNVWNKVVIDLNTHSVKGISDLDFTLAEKIDQIFAA
jgi:4a-hydroxytetrahydrobiopterin dehydratase